MIQTTLSKYKKLIAPISILIALSVTTWYVAPFITFSGQTPFASVGKRLYIMLVFVLSWVLKVILFDSPTKKAPTIPGDTAKKLELLQGRFQGAVDFLKNTIINKNNINTNLDNLPWYLFIGPTGSGKTTLLANSHAHFILAKQFKPENLARIPSSDTCDWWVTADSVMVDVPGAYCLARNSNSNTLLWNNLLDLVGKTKLNGVVITLNLPELVKKQNPQQKSQLIQDLKKRIQHMRDIFGAQLPFYLVITKCDLLPGFVEFFSESGSDELTQAWGITLPILQEREKLVDAFVHRFNVLIKRLNKQLLWRLHQERNPGVRPAIKDFPLHIERLKDGIANFLKALMIPNLHLGGVYLTSAMQNNTEETANVFSANSSLSHQALQIMRAPPIPVRSYFIKQLLLQGLFTPSDTTARTRQHFWQERAVYAASAAAVLLTAILLGQDFRHSIQKTYSIQNELAHYKAYMQQPNQEGEPMEKALPLLSELKEAASDSNPQLSPLAKVLSFYSTKSQETANAVYHQALQTIVIAEVQHRLEKYLEASASKNPEYVYSILEAYVMLGNKENRQTDFILSTVNQIIPKPLNTQQLNELSEHLTTAFNYSSKIKLNNTLLKQVRKQFTSRSSVDLGMLLLKTIENNNADSTISLGTNFGNPPIFVSKEVANRIPNMFTADNFQKIIDTEIPAVAADALKGNWILGNIPAIASQPSLASLTMQVRNQYISNYVDIWESQIANIRPFSPKNLRQTDDMIVTLTSKNSPLLQLLQTIKQNTSFPSIASASPKLQALNTLLANIDDHQQSSLYQMFVNLQQLHGYLQTILNSPNTKKMALESATQHAKPTASDPIVMARRLAEQNPEPLRTWLNTLANDSWNYIWQEAGDKTRV